MSKFIVYDVRGGWYFAGYERGEIPVYAADAHRARVFDYESVAEAVAEYCTGKNPERHAFRALELVEKAPAERTVRDLELTANEYQKLAARTINMNLTEQGQLINGVMGLCGEAGEAIDIVKKHIAQGHELDRTKLIKELGDVAWYLAETATALNVSLEVILRGNIEKLRARYPEGFETEKSLHRKAGDV